ncbi:hypothetical protein [Halococcus sediminicola]|uniref:hypothetical protein n=1 Tax=Halococcus sediminicola TaxID=1264579 RepID=UPI000A849E5C|nr:hypothetical protein [Halococcus sediminicola]
MPTAAEARTFGDENGPSRPDLPSSSVGDVSLEGQAAMADVGRRFQQQRPQMQRTVSAVDDLGLDPTGNEPVNGTLGSALSGMSNTRVVFPSGGTFALSGQVTARPSGPIELVGNGSSFVIPAGEETKSLTLVLEGGSLVRDIVIDQSTEGVVQELSIQAGNGVVRAENVTIKGYAPAKSNVGPTGNDPEVDAMFSPIARSSGSVVQVRNLTAVGGTAAGTHDEADLPESAPENRLGAPMGVWVGKANAGTIQLVNPELRAWSNGIYGGRTTGIVEIRGGTFVNNFNAQTRVGGGSVVDGASMLLDDRQWSDKGPFKIGHQGVYAVRVDAKYGNQTDPAEFKNLKIVANSMREGSSLFDWESASGPGIVRNCHITNHLDRPVFLGESPSAPATTNIMVDQCLIDGNSSAAVMEMQGRPQSKIQRTCVTTPEAGPEGVSGAQIGPGMSFGQCTSAGGLAAPDKVGAGGNISALPAPSYNGTGAAGMGGMGGAGIGKAALAAAGLLVLVGAAILIGVPAGAAGLGVLSSLILSYLLDDD